MSEQELSLHEQGNTLPLVVLVPDYMERVDGILENLPENVSVPKRVVLAFLEGLSDGVIIPRYAKKVVEGGLPRDVRFQKLLTEIYAHAILSGEFPEYPLMLMYKYKDLFEINGMEEFIKHHHKIQLLIESRLAELEKKLKQMCSSVDMLEKLRSKDEE